MARVTVRVESVGKGARVRARERRGCFVAAGTRRRKKRKERKRRDMAK